MVNTAKWLATELQMDMVKDFGAQPNLMFKRLAARKEQAKD